MTIVFDYKQARYKLEAQTVNTLTVHNKSFNMDLIKIIDYIIKHCDDIKNLPVNPILLVVTIILAVILYNNLPKIIDQFKSDKKKNKEYRESIVNTIHLSCSEIKTEQIFFDEKLKNNKRFYYHHRKQLVDDRGKGIEKISLLNKKDVLIIGSPGVGKTSIMKNLFLSKNCCLKRLVLNVVGLFFDYDETMRLLEQQEIDKNAELINCIRFAGYRKYYLYFDGIDELGDEKLEAFFSMLHYIKKNQRRVRLVISVRKRCMEENLDIFLHYIGTMHKYYVAEWTADDIERYGISLLKSLEYKSGEKRIKEIQDVLKKYKSYEILKNPLIMKMCLYLLLKRTKSNALNPDNRYCIYESFVKAYIMGSKKQNYNVRTIQNKMDELSEACFKAFEAGNKRITTDRPDPAILFKPSGSFIHETFFEFFVSRYYFSSFCDRIDKITKEKLRSLTYDYANEYADFISDAIRDINNTEKDLFLENICTIYYHTLKKSYRNEFSSLAGIPDKVNPMLNSFMNSMEKIDGKVLTIKYQIVFRLGRMHYPGKRQFLVDILDYIYNKDDEIYCKEDTAFYIALLKRGCAISSSFLGYERLELDYVRHMLSFLEDEYDVNYDLANRSHTMVFYRDVKVDRSILSFRDENPEISCGNALGKRISRLKRDLPYRLSDMDVKQLKIYYFRLFDLATVYTFLKSRDISLTTDQMRVIRECRVVFEGQSEERQALMAEIRERIL